MVEEFKIPAWIDNFKPNYLLEPPEGSISVEQYISHFESMGIKMSDSIVRRTLRGDQFDCFVVKKKDWNHPIKYYRPKDYKE